MGYVISIILFIVFIVFIVILRKNQTNKINNIRKLTIKEITKQELQKIIEEQEKLEAFYNDEEKRLEREYKLKAEEIINITNKLNTMRVEGKKAVDADLLLYRKQELDNIRLSLNKHFDEEMAQLQKLREAAEKEQVEWIAEKHIERENIQEQITALTDELSDYEKKREVINKQILMEREAKEKADFYRIVVSDYDIEDLKLISQIEQNFHNKEVLNRAVFDTYIKKPMSEMIKRVLEGRSPSGIYMITNTLTNEIYIGRAVSIDKRWQEHCKSCFNLGTIAHSTLHTRMAKEGIWNFTFQILEEVPKEKLSEREKYWINFYHSKDYGMNERQGG